MVHGGCGGGSVRLLLLRMLVGIAAMDCRSSSGARSEGQRNRCERVLAGRRGGGGCPAAHVGHHGRDAHST